VLICRSGGALTTSKEEIMPEAQEDSLSKQFAGEVRISDQRGRVTIILNGNSGDATFGTKGNDGRVFVRDQSGQIVMRLDGTSGDVTIGGSGKNGRIFLRNESGEVALLLDGSVGDVQIMNADCAENFSVAKSTELEPGDVAVFDDESSLRRSSQAYDRRVAGVISGAAGARPGIVLGQVPSSNDRLPVALIGCVYCKVDARFGSIEVGDLLTTSSTPGHAMKAADPVKAIGSVIGKALASISDGCELIPIMVALQ
jgi:hypothetical protein